MFNGAHTVIYSKDAEADRAFFRDVLEFPCADAGNDWLIFALPKSEVAFHPDDKNDTHQFFLMCESIEKFSSLMKEKNVPCSEQTDEGWGVLVKITLPGGGKLGVYEPRHARP